MKTFQLSDVDRPQIIFECGPHKLETEIMKNVKLNPNFSKSNLFFDIVIIAIWFKSINIKINIYQLNKMMPKEEIYIPPMSIKVIDHRNFGRKPIVGVHTIKSLLKYSVERDKEEFLFSNIESILSLINQSKNLNLYKKVPN